VSGVKENRSASTGDAEEMVEKLSENPGAMASTVINQRENAGVLRSMVTQESSGDAYSLSFQLMELYISVHL
jgi:hypothetical protein